MKNMKMSKLRDSFSKIQLKSINVLSKSKVSDSQSSNKDKKEIKVQ